MCGITGIWAFKESEQAQMEHLEEATERIAHRGPDYHATWRDQNVGLGHRRLSILDTSDHGHQPMQIMDGRYVMVFNGEIFNFLELRQELIAKGIHFHSHTDTEVIMHLYAREGKSCLNRLNGFFALAIYDTHEQSLFVARDRMGIKPLLYWQDESKLLFASEMQSLLAFAIDKQVDQQALHYYLQLNYTPAPLTMVKGIKKLMPGECIEIRNGVAEISTYYELLRSKVCQDLSYEEAKKELAERLEASVKKRMIADVPLGTFLSGGIDSSVITSIAARHTAQLSTFSIGFSDNPFFDETSYAELVAKKCGTNHTTFKLSNEEMLSYMADFVEHIDEPFADSSALPVYILSKKTREHVTVSLSGDGADEIFSGYNKHAAWFKMDQDRYFGKLTAAIRPIADRMPQSRSGKWSNLMRQVIRFDKAKKIAPQERYWFLAALADQGYAQRMMKAPQQQDDYYTQWMSPLADYQNINDMLMGDTKFVLPNDMLKKVDLMSMASSLEVRVPFLDHELVEWVHSLPVEYKINSKMRKRILQDTYRDILPAELYQRPKKGFEMPLLDWLKTALLEELDQTVFNRDKIEAGGQFNWDAVEKLRTKLFSTNPEDSHAQVWALYIFQKWYEKYF
ncbi:asparagine synthase (glutamine-hydrolyzing) [Reichenbachiella agariperforans]|uniref:asparagine synthase (glutamine-hydrolyzing) n=1 Tax=Reichenbachiella agariperforans TaxID=156994 RepID=UPI001C08503C|nr:asparagine synthase (glutamine-hydrolyzing) [Reichenbachiella agariperforans]MBU2915937.1 asparagine synthase (glutamine-hydrolyzing) [Reichenbachiella agariperforans]